MMCNERALAMDIGDMFTWISVGAAIEATVLAASVRGLEAEVVLLDESMPPISGERAAATLRFRTGATPDPLASTLKQRVSNRQPYDSTPLSSAELSALATAVAASDSALEWVCSEADKARLADLIVQCDRTRLEHEPFHHELFSILRFSDDEARSKGDGLTLPSLEIPANAAAYLQSIGDWKTMQEENKKGAGEQLAGGFAEGARRAGAVGLLSVASPDPKSYLLAGRALMRIWLQATQEGYSMQPIGGLPQYLTRLRLEPSSFLPEHAQRLSGLLGPLQELFPSVGRAPLAIMFRVGRALGAPSGRSYRLPLEKMAFA